MKNLLPITNQQHQTSPPKGLYFCDLYLVKHLHRQGDSNYSIFPTVSAADPEPKKPPKTRPKDLPIYDCPHSAYNEYTRSMRYLCANPKAPGLLHQALQPTVKSIRVCFQSCVKRQSECISALFCEGGKALCAKSSSAVKFFRDDNNMAIRHCAVTAGAIAGYLFAFKNGAIIKIVNVSIGAGAVGALCFPCETDQVVRRTAYYGREAAHLLYSGLHGELLYKADKGCSDVVKDPKK